ncbi:MAG: hypothetical protein WBM23_05005, partial [Desulfomonilia bacterium]
ARMQKYGLLQNIFSNRFQPSLPAKHRYALMYSLLSAKRWDSSGAIIHAIIWIEYGEERGQHHERRP